MIEVSNADRIVFPEVGRTKGDVVAYYARIAARALPHLRDRPLSMRRYPKGLAGPGFFQKNVPAHYPASIQRLQIARSREATKKHRGSGKDQDVTLYPLLSEPEHVPYCANQGAIELHVPTARAGDSGRPDRLVVDLDPPAGAFDRVRRAAYLIRDALVEFGLPSVPVATGSKGFHVVAALEPALDAHVLALASQQFATLLAHRHPNDLTIAYRISLRGERVFVDWLRNNPMATVVAPYSLRAKPRANVATPLSWGELEHKNPDSFTIADLDALLDRPDSLAELAERPSDPLPFAQRVEREFERSGLALEAFDRFRS
jgi:bifunctional non-homologous end joining protein LigD